MPPNGDLPSNCFICRSAVSIASRSGIRDAVDIACPRCGEYGLSGSLAVELGHSGPLNKKTGAAISFSVRHMSRQMRNPLITHELLSSLITDAVLPSPAEQADRMVLWLGDNLEGPGTTVAIEVVSYSSIIGALDAAGVHFILKALLDRKLIIGANQVGPVQQLSLSFTGWQEYAALKKGSVVSRRAFMAMAYSNLALTNIYREQLRPATKQAGFDLRRLDEEPPAGLLDARLRVEIQLARFVVADLTDANAGAYWEAGYAEGLGKPVIYTCRHDVFTTRGTHFDTSHHHTIKWDPDNPADAAQALKATIRATLPAEARMQDE